MRTLVRVVSILGIVLLALLAGVFLLARSRAAPRKPSDIPLGDYSHAVDYADRRLRQLMDQHHLPSVAVALIDDQEVVWQQAYGLANVEEETPASTATVYKLWSVAKVFTAIETMRLVEEGLLDLDAPITDYLPDFSIHSRFPASGPITVRSILAHHAGLPRNECHWVEYRPGDSDGLARLVASLQDCYMAYPVGYRYKYTNIGPDTLGYLVQELRGQGFAGYMQENLLAPMGMANSAFASEGVSRQDGFALGYEYYEGEYYPYQQGDIAELPSGNLYSTIEDMSAFARFVFRGGEAQGEQLIAADTLSMMFEDQYSNPADPQPMGLGWKTARVLGSELLVWHDGGPGEGIGALVALLPERKLGLVLFANAISLEGVVSVPVALDILEVMLQTKFGAAPAEEVTPEPLTLDPALLEGYTGRYLALGEVMEVSLSGDQLQGTIAGMTFDLVPAGQNKFRINHWLLSLGLADLLQLPMDLRELEIEFLPGDEISGETMMINFGDVSYEYCPRYPDVQQIPALWAELTGHYELVRRLSSRVAASEVVGRTQITIEDGILKMPNPAGPLLPISETEIIPVSGPFAGETMLYEPDTGLLIHQSIIYKPTWPAPN